MQDYRKLKIWLYGIEIVKDTYKIAALLPGDERYGISTQIKRAAISVPSNIAEGAGRYSQKDFARYIQIAIGSLFELETNLVIISELELIPRDCKNLLFKLQDKIQLQKKMVFRLLNKV